MSAAKSDLRRRPDQASLDEAASVGVKLRLTLTALYDRWLDERGLEPFQGYADLMEAAALKLGAATAKASARPFSLRYTHQGRCLVVKVTSRHYTIEEAL